MAATDEPTCLLLEPTLQDIDRLIAWLGHWCGERQLDIEVLNTLCLCAEELAVNIINHGFNGLPSAPISVCLERRDGEIHLILEDRGKPFDPTRAPTPQKAVSLEEAPIGGWGIHLVKQFSRAMHYQREDGKNRLEVCFSAQHDGAS